jgi:hypothetical protein
MIAGTSVMKRGGSASIPTLLTVPGLLLLVGLVIYVGTLRGAKNETQNGADAAALAAALNLVSDDLLTVDVRRAGDRLSRSRRAAVTLGHANFAGGERLTLDPNVSHDPGGDVVFGHLDHPVGGNFEPAGPDVSDCVGDRVNAVRITLRRAPVRAPFGGNAPQREVVARSTAMLDWSVVGFRPNNDLPIPLIPIGIFTDHKGERPDSWDTHCRRRERDERKYDYDARKFLAGNDGIPELSVVLGPRTSDHETPGTFLRVGVGSFGETIEQVRSGLNRHHLDTQFGAGGFVFGVDNTLHMPSSSNCPGVGQPGRSAIDAALGDVLESGEPRLWPLFSASEKEDSVRVTGWVAARVVAREPAPGGGIKLILQPAVLSHPSAVTEHRSSPPVYCATNRTVCRVRLAE